MLKSQIHLFVAATVTSYWKLLGRLNYPETQQKTSQIPGIFITFFILGYRSGKLGFWQPQKELKKKGNWRQTNHSEKHFTEQELGQMQC